MFGKILIANRGEIAVRIAKTARRLGIATIAVHSDADRRALHVRVADEAIHIGPAPAAESYLDIDRILNAAQRTGAEAIHPGYGFLSENADFAEAVEAAGLVFIGPPPSAIRAMGLKDAAKRRMLEAGIPVVPGYHRENQNPAILRSEADAIGYPVLIKARAGGGGKGMRRVDGPAEFEASLDACRREATSAFGDAACLIESYIQAPRHIEIQILGDRHGNLVHLFERDCSLQRRHQKVIEEAPAPGMTREMREAMGHAAIEAARAVGYHGAGTVEFIADASEGLRLDRFWFMEMNTRLQVEHPVTEAITGLDLVEWQLRIAAGEALSFSQAEVTLTGHAVEARIYAEIPRLDFLPATGTIEQMAFPDGLRVDSGVRQGDTVTPFYDPMVAKLIAHAPSRTEALARLAAGLRGTRIIGLPTNLVFLARLLGQPAVVSGEIDTGLIGRDLRALVSPAPTPTEAVALLALACLRAFDRPASTDPWDRLQGFRHFQPEPHGFAMEIEGERHELDVTWCGDRACVETGGTLHEITILDRGSDPRIEIDGRLRDLRLVTGPSGVTLTLDSETFEGAAAPATLSKAAAAGEEHVRAPMPGTVILVDAAAGDRVAMGQALIVIEAMKMEHRLCAPRDGVLAEVTAARGDRVEAGSVLVRMEPT